ncbi:hypothetical protein SAMN04488121_112146 [Chitinophaga filiformis]|uniref:Uncharacterized protein n=1 Tax=Chitinophaga filiformis TaxID=104663 RepID=A0A1G8CHN5_CHIFI|nr:hypothetical protein SAMN04488121_112146 [Chitinophaga filiformis]
MFFGRRFVDVLACLCSPIVAAVFMVFLAALSRFALYQKNIIS